MFSFAGDLVLDPFLGTGSTTVAAVACGRNSTGVEVDAGYVEIARGNVLKAVAARRDAGAVRAELAAAPPPPRPTVRGARLKRPPGARCIAVGARPPSLS